MIITPEVGCNLAGQGNKVFGLIIYVVRSVLYFSCQRSSRSDNDVRSRRTGRSSPQDGRSAGQRSSRSSQRAVRTSPESNCGGPRRGVNGPRRTRSASRTRQSDDNTFRAVARINDDQVTVFLFLIVQC